MAAPRSVKEMPRPCRIVGVITTLAELRTAVRMPRPPDLFELRLDHLVGLEQELESNIGKAGAPIIITARHPAEGGANNLSLKQRRELIWRFLPCAQYVDVELRSARALRPLLQRARETRVQCILSFHHLELTPSSRSLHAKAVAAKAHGADVFKVATRTDTLIQLSRLLNFAANDDAAVPISAMGIGKFGAISRVLLARNGLALVG